MNELSPTLPVAVREEERRHLARLLEKRLGQSLNLLLAQANAYHTALPPSAAQAVRTLTAMAGRTLADLHDLVADLDPTALQDLGLGPALETLALRIERRYGLAVTLDLAKPTAVPTHLALAAYRIALEALHNAGQHAGAGRIGLSLRLERGSLRLTIADDGDGFRPPEPLETGARPGDWPQQEEKRGLAEMAERAAAVGGELEISSVLGVGTQVRAHLPLTPPEQLGQTPASAGDPLVESLTPREQEVLAGAAAGLTNKQIAARLGISDRTVQFHLGNVLGKLGVASRTEAAVLALQRGLV
jgi:signal transduction histidine kinase/DNA-binding CsgD family transcriptional regulator